MKIKFISFLLFFIIFNSMYSYGYTSLPIWSDLDTEEVNAKPNISNYLSLESESAILIEQSSRSNIV